MIDDKHLELLHAEIDGELTTEQRADLSRYLLGNPEGRAAREQLRRLSTALEGVRQESPPAGLRESILGALPVQAAAMQPGPSRFDSHRAARRSAWRTAPALRYAAVFVGGLLAGAIAFQLGLDGRAGPDGSQDASQMAGTMASPEFVSGANQVDALQVTLDQVTGRVSLHRAPSKLLLDLDLAAREPVEVVVAHGGEEMHLTGFGPTGSPADRRMAVVLPVNGTGGQVVELKFLASGRVIQQATLGAGQAH